MRRDAPFLDVIPSKYSAHHVQVGDLSRLAHESLAKVYGVVDDLDPDDRAFHAVVQPLMPASLHARIRDAALPPLGMAARIETLASVAAALAFLYEERVIHGSVKASNVLLDKHGCVCWKLLGRGGGGT